MALREQAEQLASKQREWLRVTLGSIGDAVMTTDTEGRVTYLNSVAQFLTGWTPEEAIGQPLETVFTIVNEHSRQPVENPVEKVLREGVTLGLANHTILIVKGGGERPIDDSAAPIRDQAGVVIGVVLVFRDVTERKVLEDNLRQSAADLSEADRRKDEFLATLAHELRNPLAPIRNSLQILKMPRVDAATAQQTREMMERQVHHLVRLVDDLLDVSRVMRGKIELRRESVELATVVARAVETAQPLIEVQGHRLDISTAARIAAPRCRPGATGSGRRQPADERREVHRGERSHLADGPTRRRHAVLRVRDDGIGIAPDMLPRIFELFVQVDHASTKAQGGLGIGLTLVKNLVEMHGGTVEARSDGLGKGSEFVVRLPLWLGEQPQAMTDRVENCSTGPCSSLRAIGCWSWTTTRTPPSVSPCC